MTPPQVNPESEQKLAALVRKHSAALLSYFRKRVADRSEAEDMVQDVFLRLTKHGLNNVEQSEAYLFRTAVNVLRDRIRSRSARPHMRNQVPLEEDYVDDGDCSPEHVLMGREALSLFEVSLRELPTRTQEVFALSRFEDWRSADIAKKYGISVSAVEKHLARALAHLYERMKDSL